MFANIRDSLRTSLEKPRGRLRGWTRTQVQRLPPLGSARLIIGAVMGFLLIALIYLAQSSNAAMILREVRVKEQRIAELNRENAQLRYEIAALTAPSAIEQRARKLGLGPAKRVIYADMPWLKPEPNEIMPAFLPHATSVSVHRSDSNANLLDQLLFMLGLSSGGDYVNAQTR